MANNHSALRLKGILLAITGACLWGLGGTVSDFFLNIIISISIGTSLLDL
ncbi:hypothetical protein SASC256_04280 [Staphylococcus argenteus]|nr:hypothetical protein SA19061_03630 [Staphylococcus argenteus]GJF54613.1 hypothetical protein SA19088_13560 [Staphylococcus argenteus]GJF60621.1 hypothetical protein SA19105_21090 [Staphylococcus argenteus]GJF73629.1 hypothetical protein SA19202_22370 [Staphylococcus argenteus]GJF86336.1 hypothetical protein SA20015_20450 [Staphylococcus argenteus]